MRANIFKATDRPGFLFIHNKNIQIQTGIYNLNIDTNVNSTFDLITIINIIQKLENICKAIKTTQEHKITL
jgi:flagellar basal body rod protein FlgF